MKRVVIHIQAGPGSTWRDRLLGVTLAGIILSIFLLLMLGIWIALAAAATLAILVGLTRAFFPSALGGLRFPRRAPPSMDTHTAAPASTPSLKIHGDSPSSVDDSHTPP